MPRLPFASYLFATTFLAVGIAFAPLPAGAQEPADDGIVRYSTTEDFYSVKDALEMAIVNQGLVINSESHIDEMLDRTGADLGNETRIYEHAVAFEFCSARFSRLIMDSGPHNILFCPFVISVYQLPAETDKVYVAYRRPRAQAAGDASKEALSAVSGLLDAIATEATE